MPGRSRLSIRTLVGLLIGAIGLMLIAQSSTLVLLAVPRYFGAQRVVSLTHADEVTFKTLLYRRQSATPVIAALNAENSIDDREAGTIAENRHLADAIYPETVSVLRDLNLEGIAAVVENLRFASAAWTEVSAKADAAIHLAKPARDRASVADEIARATAAIEATRAAAEFIDAAIAPIDPVADRLIEVRRAAWSMRDQLEDLFRMGDAAANDGRAWPLEKIIASAGRRGKVERDWAYLTGFARRPDTPQPLINAIANAGQWYVGVNQTDQQGVLRPLTPDANTPSPTARASQTAVLAALADIASGATDALTDRADEMLVDATRSLVIGGMSLVIATMVTLVALLICRQRVGRPLSAMTRALRCLAERDPQIDLPAAGQGEEIDVASNAMLMFCAEIRRADDLAATLGEHADAAAQLRADAVAEIEEILAQQTEKVEPLTQSLALLAEGDLTGRLVEPLPVEFASLSEHFHEALGFLQVAMRQVLTHIGTIHSTTNGIADEADALARRTGFHSSTLRQALTALDALTATVEQSQLNSEQARRLAATAADQAAQAAGMMASCVTAVGTIGVQTHRLGGLASQVDELAFAINLAALKAGVEAARSGTAGSGQSGTEGELAELSQRASAVAGEMTRAFAAATQQTTDSTQWIRDAGRDLDRIRGEIGELSATLERCVSSGRTQSMGLEAFRTLIQHIEQVTLQNLSAAEQTTKSVGALAEEADLLKATMWRFRVDEGPEATRAAA